MSRLDEAVRAVEDSSEWAWRPTHEAGTLAAPSTVYASLTRQQRLELMGYTRPGNPPGYLKDIEEEIQR